MFMLQAISMVIALCFAPPIAPTPTPPPAVSPPANTSPATTPPAAKPPTTTPPANFAPTFPASWVGRWIGASELITPTSVVSKFQMELIVSPSDDPLKFNWTIIYDGAFGKQERKYWMWIKDAAKGEFLLDEQNSIQIPMRMIGGVLRASFAVNGSRTVVREEVVDAGQRNERMLVEMVTTSEDGAQESGGQDGVPKVYSWPTQSVQRGILRRVGAPGAEP